MTSKTALVSLSGGLDSTVSLHWALNKKENNKKNNDKESYKEVYVVFFDYGQKALESEQKTTQMLCKRLKVHLYEVSLSFINEFSNSSLNTKKGTKYNSKDSGIKNDIPENIDLQSDDETKESAKSVWVPNRNGLFINAAASILESLGGGDLILGFNKEEAKTFPDNSEDFLKASNISLGFSTQGRVKLVAPTLNLDKVQIYKLGEELGFDSDSVWPCYFSADLPCGRCESCLRFFRAKAESHH